MRRSQHAQQFVVSVTLFFPLIRALFQRTDLAARCSNQGQVLVVCQGWLYEEAGCPLGCIDDACIHDMVENEAIAVR